MRNLCFLFSTIKSGYLYRKNLVKVKNNKYFFKVLTLLYNEGFINGYFIDNKHIFIFLKYYYNKPLIGSLKNISKTSNRNYYQIKTIQKNLKTCINDILIISTNQGLLTSKEALINKVGGELLCIISN